MSVTSQRRLCCQGSFDTEGMLRSANGYKSDTSEKKRWTRRNLEMIVELILEAEKAKKAADLCRREGIIPISLYR